MSPIVAAVPGHKVQVWTQTGPAGMSETGATCTCGWRGPHGTEEQLTALAAEHTTTAASPSAVPAVVEPEPGTDTVRWTDQQTEIIRRSVAPECSDDELAFFAQVCRHRGLDPFAGEICAVMRWNEKLKRKTMTIQETVAGLRSIATRSGLYAGQDQPQWCGRDGTWRDVWLETGPPAAARVAVYRHDWTRPAVGIGTYAEFVQLDRAGKPLGLWSTHPATMLAKTAERQALIRAFTSQMGDTGINTRPISTASKISMEARNAGLDNDQRHQLVAELTDGRTDSTRDLTPDEIFEVRAALAQLRPDPEPARPSYVDDDGVVHVPEPEEEVPTGPGGDRPPPGADLPPPEVAHPPAPEPPPDPHHDLRATLKTRARNLTDYDRQNFVAWLDQTGIGAATRVNDFTEDHLYAVEAYFAQLDEEPF